MSDQMSAEQIREFAEAGARVSFEADGFVIPVFLVFSLVEGAPKMSILPIPGLPKDIAVALVRAYAIQCDAYAIASVTESRVANVNLDEIQAPGESVEAAVQRWRERQPADLREIAGTREVVQVLVEHQRSQLLSLAEITRERPGDEESPGTLGPFAVQADSRLSGRFARLLPGARGE